MSVQPFSTRSKTAHGLAFAITTLCIAAYSWITPATISAQQTNDLQTPNGRVLKDEIPKHLPIKVKIKNADSEKWLEDMELEVANMSDKPIYYMRFSFILTDVTISGKPVGFPLVYGRNELVDFTVTLNPDDVPIQPKATYTFGLTGKDLHALELFEKKHSLNRNIIKNIRLLFHKINFGDGTGFSTTGGLPFPQRQAKSPKRHGTKDRIGSALFNSEQFMPEDSSSTWLKGNLKVLKQTSSAAMTVAHGRVVVTGVQVGTAPTDFATTPLETGKKKANGV